jgi:hypothetical protein
MNLLKAKNGISLGVLTLASLIACGSLYGQQDAGVLRVLAQDQSAGAAAGASVKVTNVGTNTSTSQVTNSQGYATFSPIARGTYVVEVSLAGFAPVRLSGVSIDVNQNRLETVSLQLATVSTQVEVTAAAAVIQTEDASLGQVVGGNVISELPLAARRYTDLTLLMPGSADAQVTISTRGPGWLVVNGNTQTMNNFLLDGFDNNQNTHNMQSRSAQVMQPSPDTLSEFKVQTNNYTAEFGRAMGAVINASIKSGTNQLHGSAWWYNRDASLAANSWQANWQNTGKSNLKWNQSGGTLGGPIRKNKLFIFGDYENFRSLVSAPALATIPTMAERAGDFSALTITLLDPAAGETAFPGNKIPANRFDPLAAKVFNTVYPAPNFASGLVGSGGRPSNNYSANPATTQDVNKFDVRVDYYLSSRNRLFARYSFSQDFQFQQSTLPPLADTDTGNSGGQYARNQAFGGSWNFTISPTKVNELRYGYTKTASNFTAVSNGGETGTQFGFVGIPEVLDQVGGLPRMSLSGYSGVGVRAFRPQYSNPYVHQVSDSFSWVKGTQTLKFGFDYRFKEEDYVDLTNRTLSYVFDSNYTKDGAGDMLLGYAQSLGGETFFQTAQLQTVTSAYVQDDWKVRPNLTVNLGLRWEFTTPFWGGGGPGGSNVNYDYAAKQLVEAPGLPLVYGGRTGPNKFLQNMDYKDFGPRLGVAYQITKRLVIRSGFGIFFNGQDFLGTSGGNLLFAPPNVYILSLARVGLTGTPPAILSQPVPANLLNTSSILASNTSIQTRPNDWITARVYQWNVATQFATSKSSNVELAYVGNSAYHLEDGFNPNQVPYGQDGSVIANRRFPQWQSYNALEYRARSHYNALQAKFEKRMTKGWYNLISYTYACGLSAASSFGSSGGGTQYYDFSQPVPLPIFEPAFNEQLSRQRLSVTNIWKMPIGRGAKFGSQMSKALDLLIGGWQTQFIVTTRSGLPVNVTMPTSGVDPTTGKSFSFFSGQGGGQLRPNIVGDPNTGISPEDNRAAFLDPKAFALQPINTPGNAARNVAWGPSAFNIDGGITKRFSFWEGKSIDFRMELFNLMNHVNFGQPASSWGSSNFGLITTTANGALGASRQIQLALRLAF